MEAFTLEKEYLDELKAKVARGEISHREAKNEIVELMTSVLR